MTTPREIDTSKFNPPVLSTEESLKRYKLQLEALESYDGPDRATMLKWVNQRIDTYTAKLKRERAEAAK